MYIVSIYIIHTDDYTIAIGGIISIQISRFIMLLIYLSWNYKTEIEINLFKQMIVLRWPVFDIGYHIHSMSRHFKMPMTMMIYIFLRKYFNSLLYQIDNWKHNSTSITNKSLRFLCHAIYIILFSFALLVFQF